MGTWTISIGLFFWDGGQASPEADVNETSHVTNPLCYSYILHLTIQHRRVEAMVVLKIERLRLRKGGVFVRHFSFLIDYRPLLTAIP